MNATLPLSPQPQTPRPRLPREPPPARRQPVPLLLWTEAALALQRARKNASYHDPPASVVWPPFGGLLPRPGGRPARLENVFHASRRQAGSAPCDLGGGAAARRRPLLRWRGGGLLSQGKGGAAAQQPLTRCDCGEPSWARRAPFVSSSFGSVRGAAAPGVAGRRLVGVAAAAPPTDRRPAS